jgi:hypothetical protein
MFHQDLEELTALVRSPMPFAFVRFGDGEVDFLRGHKRRDRDGWTTTGKSLKLIQMQLGKVLEITEEDFYIGTLCRGDRRDLAGHLWPRIKQALKYITFSRLFMYGNTEKARTFFAHELTEPIFLVANRAAEGKKIGTNFIEGTYFWRDRIVDQWHKHSEATLRELRTLAMEHQNQLFLVAGGPVAKIAIAQMWKANRANRYVDIGSTLDREIHGRSTRLSHDPSHGQSRGVLRWHRR